MIVQDDFHLTYCTNIHPGEDWLTTYRSLEENLLHIKKKVSPDSKFGVGLRLSNKASEELNSNDNLTAFKNWLEANDLYVFTMNGFPYGNFHGERVKDKVHEPDWTTSARLEYTERLFDQLSILLPKGMAGGISTSPISYKHWYTNDNQRRKALKTGAKNMAKIALKLYEVEQESGSYLHLDVEPEPDGLLENTAEVIDFYENYLVNAAHEIFGAHGIENSDKWIKRYITICYDVCHFALAFEAPEFTFSQLAKHKINVGKIQISAALKIVWNNNNEDEVWRSLKAFDEPVYLHQVTEKINGKVKTYADLPEILAARNKFKELRAHFHVPIFLEDFGLLQSTQDQIVDSIYYLKVHKELCAHLEVETYTWEVLPEVMKIPLTDSVARELNWVKKHLK